MDGQAALHLYCSQTPEDRFSRIEAQIVLCKVLEQYLSKINDLGTMLVLMFCMDILDDVLLPYCVLLF